MDQYCNYCKKSYHKFKFIRIVTRLTHNLDCDENGVSYYLKPCKMCANCRKASYIKKMKK